MHICVWDGDFDDRLLVGCSNDGLAGRVGAPNSGWDGDLADFRADFVGSFGDENSLGGGHWHTLGDGVGVRNGLDLARGPWLDDCGWDLDGDGLDRGYRRVSKEKHHMEGEYSL